MHPELQQTLIELAYAVGIGVFVGLERAHSETAEHGASDELLGVRTFSLFAVFGWLSGYLGAHVPWLAPAGMLAAGALLAAAHLRARGSGGITTDVAAALVFALGMLVRFDRSLAIIIAIAATLALISKPWVRAVVPKVRRIELLATLQVLIILAVVLPLLPQETVDPWGAIAPREIGWFVLLIGGISYVGYFASRFLGERRSAGLVGLVGGLASSTATTAAMAQRARDWPAMVVPGQLSTFVANAMMFGRVLIITGVVAPNVVPHLLAPMVAMGLVMLAGAWLAWRQTKADSTAGDESGEALSDLKNPFALVPALKWGVLISAVLVVAEIANQHVGRGGLLLAALVSGAVDVDAITLAVSRQVTAGSAELSTGAIAITVAVIANTVFKGGIAMFVGRSGFARRVIATFAASIAVGLVTLLFL